jgi:hypothetical protein
MQSVSALQRGDLAVAHRIPVAQRGEPRLLVTAFTSTRRTI